MSEPAPAPKKRFGCLQIFLVLFLIVSLVLNVMLFMSLGAMALGSFLETESKSFRENVVEPSPSAPRDLEALSRAQEKDLRPDRIVVISLNGMIESSSPGTVGVNMVEDLRMALRQALQDKQVKAIILEINSPGGEVFASEEIYHELRLAREKKPIITRMGLVAASGGYYAALGTNWIIAGPSTATGSVGVILQALNVEDLFDKVGLQSVVFKSGEMKDLLSGTRPITEAEREYVERIVSQLYERFLGTVAEEREIELGTLRRGPGDGRVVLGQDAQSLNLIDELGGWREAVAKARDLGEAPDAEIVRYQAAPNFERILGSLAQGRQKVEVELPLVGGPRTTMQPGRWYWLAPDMTP